MPKGELLEALPESEQPGDSTRIALGGIDRKLRLECRMEDVKKLTPEEAGLLLGISSTKSRFEIYFDGKQLDFGKRLKHGSHVLVSIQHVSEKLPGVVRFKGVLPNLPGTMFGVELHVHQNPGFGTCDGTYGNKRYFKCDPDSGVFVGFDKLAPLKDDNSELTTASDSPKRDDHCEVNMTELDLVFPSFGKGKSHSELPQARDLDSSKINQRVVTFRDKGPPLRGTVHYTGDMEDSSGHVKSVAGLELVGIILRVVDTPLIVFFFVTSSTVIFIYGFNYFVDFGF